LEPSDSMWVPAFLFALLGFFFLQKAIRPGAQQSWSWGRGGGSVPVSRWGYACWAATFFAIASILSHALRPPMAGVVVFLICFLITMGVGFVDTYRYNKAQRSLEPRSR
jgi:phosphatidylglycerophosphate synthase